MMQLLKEYILIYYLANELRFLKNWCSTSIFCMW